MKGSFKSIKNKFQQLKKPTENTKEIIKLSLWILGTYLSINLLPFINSLLSYLPSGLFLVLLLNVVIIAWLLIKTYFDILAIKRALHEANARQFIINTIYSINQALFVGFNIYTLLCLINTH